MQQPHNSPSYPSGHTTAAFAAATVLSHLIPEWKHHFIEHAIENGYARVYGGVHFPSDVERGAWLGTFVGDFVMAERSTPRVRWNPMPAGE